MTRHGLPATLTSTGRVVSAFIPGPAEGLTGTRRWREIHHRLRAQHGRTQAARLTWVAWRHGVTLSGPAVRRALDGTDQDAERQS